MTPNNSHTTVQLFKRIQQKKDEFSDTLLAYPSHSVLFYFR
jgi:hypothetical protein